MSAKESEYRIFVGGLSWDITERQLEDAFSRFGKVVDCQVWIFYPYYAFLFILLYYYTETQSCSEFAYVYFVCHLSSWQEDGRNHELFVGWFWKQITNMVYVC